MPFPNNEIKQILTGNLITVTYSATQLVIGAAPPLAETENGKTKVSRHSSHFTREEFLIYVWQWSQIFRILYT